jgi:hypothetical protein
MKVLIRSARESFRRAGIQFTREGVVVDVSELTEAQREAITHEPQLSVSPAPEENDANPELQAKAAAEKKAADARAKEALKPQKKAAK